MKLLEEIGDMTKAMEGETPPTYQEAYTMLLRAFIEIRRLDHRIRVLEGNPS
jgi:hypothetical protein